MRYILSFTHALENVFGHFEDFMKLVTGSKASTGSVFNSSVIIDNEAKNACGNILLRMKCKTKSIFTEQQRKVFKIKF